MMFSRSVAGLGSSEMFDKFPSVCSDLKQDGFLKEFIVDIFISNRQMTKYDATEGRLSLQMV